MPKDNRTADNKKAVADLSEDELQDLSGIKQRRSRLNAKPIRHVMRSLMARRGYGQTEARSQLEQQWSEIVGPELAAMTRPGNHSRGVLSIYADSSIALQELNFQKRRVIARLAETLPQLRIQDLRMRIAKLS